MASWETGESRRVTHLQDGDERSHGEEQEDASDGARRNGDLLADLTASRQLRAHGGDEAEHGQPAENHKCLRQPHIRMFT